MDDWQIVLLHTRQTTLLQRSFEAAFPGRVVSLYLPELARERKCFVTKNTLVNYFKRHVLDSGIWKNRVLTIYGDGNFHHWTYALTRLALDRRNVGEWTYFHFDQHRDDWGQPNAQGFKKQLDCANFVDQIAYDYSGTPFMVGPECYPRRDAAGYTIGGKHIPLYHNWFTQKLQKSKRWRNNVRPSQQTGLELPATADLRATPTESYLSFDLDLLSHSEIVTNYDQNDDMTLRRVGQILDKVRPHKRIFSADMMGFPDWNQHHALSCLTMVILARKIMGLGVERLLKYHTEAKRRQAMVLNGGEQTYWGSSNYWRCLEDKDRESPIEEGELLEVLNWAQ
jgi:hypothetical protein